jgi:predicted esterase
MSLFYSIEKCINNLVKKSINTGLTSAIYNSSKKYDRIIPENSTVYFINNDTPKNIETKKNNNSIVFNNNYLIDNEEDNNYIESVSVIKINPKVNNYPNKIILFSHGNSMNIYTISNFLTNLSNKLNIIVMCYDYPSYGDTKGIPTEKSCIECLNIVIKSIKKEYETILLIGYSLGTGVIIDYVSNNEWDTKILLVAPYTSIPRVLINYTIMDNIIPDHSFKSINKIINVKCPVKIVHGENDYIVKVSHGKELYESLCNKILTPCYLPNVGHTDILHKMDDIFIEFINTK